jgi:hypothetical protein
MRKATVWALALAAGFQISIDASARQVREARQVLSGFLARAAVVRSVWMQPGAPVK